MFLNPATTNGQTHLTRKTSFDDCKTWSNSELIDAGNSAYSFLIKLPDGKVGIFFEKRDDHAYEKMTFMTFEVEDIELISTLLGF